MDPWLEVLWDQGGSDLLLAGGSAPRIRVNGKLNPVEGAHPLTAEQIDEMALPLLTSGQRMIFNEQMDVDFSFSWRDLARIRGSMFTQRGQSALALRIIPSKIPSFADLGLPFAANLVVEQPRGFVLVTGPTGSGKSTTLASIIDRINATRAAHILTIEDPVEYVHNHKMSAVTQREIGLDSPSFDRALRSALREDPDVLLIGEMRDIDSIQIALTMAETGHLVLATLHTNDAPQAVDRIIDVFPAERQEQTKVQLAASLSTIVAQRLIPKIGGGMVAAFEVLVATNSVRNLIREGRSSQLTNVMFTGTKDGMQTLESSLAKLITDGVVSYEDALAASAHPKELARHIEPSGRPAVKAR
ncbi:MAG: type IV pilus twitching motility protein PilT [Actinomycetota bacterium]|nr:MAG: type IV pilus twitching motility protein PilT [Actinomycetota bacterium]